MIDFLKANISGILVINIRVFLTLFEFQQQAKCDSENNIIYSIKICLNNNSNYNYFYNRIDDYFN